MINLCYLLDMVSRKSSEPLKYEKVRLYQGMKDFLLKIFNSEIMYYVVVPIVVVFLGWIKNEHDIKEKNKELGYWMMKCKKLPTFPDIAFKIYKMLAFNLLVMYLVRIIFYVWQGILFSYILSGLLYFGVNCLIIFLNCRSAKGKVEFWTGCKCKVALVFALYLIYGLPFFLGLYGKYTTIVEIMFGILLFVWTVCLFRYCDMAFILDNRYADIYVKGSEKAQFAEAGSIRKQGEWILVNRYVNGYDEEIRIRESDIVRIDYYGGPMVVVEKRRLFQKR